MKVTLEGFKEYVKILDTLGDQKLVNKILKDANREAVKPAQRSLKGLPYGRLKSKMSIRAAAVDGKRHPNAVIVGPLSDVYPIRWVDKGTVRRYTKAGAYRGMIKGRNLIENLLDEQTSGILKTAQTKYAESLIKATEKYTKKIK